jgi:hypothetical protein
MAWLRNGKSPRAFSTELQFSEMSVVFFLWHSMTFRHIFSARFIAGEGTKSREKPWESESFMLEE